MFGCQPTARLPPAANVGAHPRGEAGEAGESGEGAALGEGRAEPGVPEWAGPCVRPERLAWNPGVPGTRCGARVPGLGTPRARAVLAGRVSPSLAGVLATHSWGLHCELTC